ncbi:distal membrane-arm assembly complex protein 2 [Brachyhypopomus gauderio]|uniref:distal membrane-arm assembly complex protein 2 n=1 Tax=Brachyhypopomus gauderio TaxID=698409 RepID=UPI004042C532
MAASMLSRARTGTSALARVPAPKRLVHAAPPSRFTKFLLRLSQRYYDVEHALHWGSRLRTRALRQKNVYFGYTKERYGVNMAAAYYILHLGGGFRFTGQSEWFRANSKGKFSFDFLNSPDSSIEEIDVTRTLINHNGLDNIVSQRGLCSLRVQGCPQVDDWFLARLHVFGDTLQELDVSHCPRVTVGGLAALQHLRKLRRLDVSSLEAVANPGLVHILLEEMLPLCKVTGADYEQGLIRPSTVEQVEGATIRDAGANADTGSAR